MIRAVVITEGEIDCVLRFKSRRQLNTYRRGFDKGAGLYGGGTWGIYAEDELLALDQGTAAMVRERLEQ